MAAASDQDPSGAATFSARYARRLDPAAREALGDDVSTIASAHAALGARREPGEVLVRLDTFPDHTRLQIVVDDQPWLVASLRTLLTRRGRTLRRFLHPILELERDGSGQLTDVVGDDGSRSPGIRRESFMHVETDRVDAARLPALETAVRGMLATLERVRAAREPLAARLASMIERVDDVEQAAFLSWLDARQFVPFGAARVPLDADGHPTALEAPLGLLADDAGRGRWTREDFLPARLDARFADDDVAVMVCKAGRASPLIRDAEADLIIVTRRDGDGRLTEVDCLVGLFVPGLDTEAVNAIPWMRDRVHRVVVASGLAADAHDGKALVATLRSLPRDMLLQTRSARLLEIAQGIAEVQQHRQTRVFSSADPLGRYWNCLVYLPNDAYTRDLRLLIERRLERGIGGFATGFESLFASTSPLARIHFVIRTRGHQQDDPDWRAIEADIASATVSWAERLQGAFSARATPANDAPGEDGIAALMSGWGGAFPTAYRERHSSEEAVGDALFIERHLADGQPAITPIEVLPDAGSSDDAARRLRFRLHSPGRSVALSEAIPLFENLGFQVDSERPFELTPADAPPVHTLIFTVHAAIDPLDPIDAPEPLADLGRRLQETFAAVYRGQLENDGFNRLVYAAGLEPRQANLLRSLGRYLVQARAPFSIGYIIDALVAQASIARSLVQLFERRLAPASGDRPHEATPGSTPASTPDSTDSSTDGPTDGDAAIASIEQALDGVASLDQDRILRRLLGTLLAVLRTNYWRTRPDGEPRDVLSFKFDCAAVPSLPLPRPKYEIFVASPRVDGVHLRGGDVARGGLRWSDRREDYRTEVLGLMKAQMVKNAVIVPVGSKGGFYVKADLPADRTEAQTVVIDCYRAFLSGLLDVTDDLVVDHEAPGGSRVVPPPDVHRLDGDDPYLVVAADKGTATFSDHANRLALEYGFWLGDAFASGGSAGYDHKRMGITARGAWESVKRHFRGLGLDTQATPFTVVGIGDMGGDVFGNGMLLSTRIRLVAAFNHLHVFIDPTPSTTVAWAERKRLFDLPRSSWDDYDRSLISAGGGIWSRSEKRIELSAEARNALGTDIVRFTPDELIATILRAPVDLLWNGGIGTYVKAVSETHADAADRANDAVRVDGATLRARVVGEGGNLGFTQRGRIEFALAGERSGDNGASPVDERGDGAGRIYTDAIDNAAGVNCSDHEVNIKILLNAAIANGSLERDARDELLESMTDEVGLLVVRDNYLQSECIDVHHAEGLHALPDQGRLMDTLEAAGRLDRDLEYLPDAERLAERLTSDTPLTRPEVSVLVSYAKMTLFDEVLSSRLPDRPERQSLLQTYFPVVLRERFGDEIAGHRLAREIVATVATNALVNRLGPTFAGRMQAEFGVDGATVVDAFLAVDEVFELESLYASVESLDNSVTPAVQLRMLQLVRGLGERATHWMLRTFREVLPEADQVQRWRDGVAGLSGAMPDCLSAAPRTTHDARVAYFVDGGAPAEIAARVSAVVPLSSALDLVEIANSQGTPVGDIANLYFALGEYLDLHWLRDAIAELEASNPLHLRARSELRSDLHYQHRHLAAEIAARATEPSSTGAAPIGPDDIANDRLDAWARGNQDAVARYRALIGDIRGGTNVDFVTLSLAVNELHKLLRSRRPLG